MENNLNKVENTLRSIAKRYKSVKYSLGLAILFLMMGISAFSEDVVSQGAVAQKEIMSNEQIAESKGNLKNSIGNLQSKIDTARAENEKELKGLRLELIQLMEQGNQVIKSPWKSWQFGANYIYSKWNGTYKGRGDKKDKSEIFQRDTTMAKYQANASNMKNGTTNLAMVSEPNAEIEVSAGIVPKNVNKAAPAFSPKAPPEDLPQFNPKLITPPNSPANIVVNAPSLLSPPDINFKGKGFGQGAAIGMPKGAIVIQNYDSYDTVDKNTNTKGTINIEVGNLAGGIKSRWWGSNLDGTVNPNVQMKGETNVPNTATPGLTKGGFNLGGVGVHWLSDGTSTTPLNAFINELRDHNATISGNYVLTNKGGEGDINRNVIFLSHNPAGVGNGGGSSNANNSPGGYYDGQAKPLEKTATFDGNLTLHGTPNVFTGNTASSDVTIGVEHQLWSNRVAGDWITEGAYSTFNNTGKITLASGNNLVGILIDVEAWGNGTLADNSGVPHKTKNNGTIEITNAQNSIGIDYGEYSNLVFKSELTVGNIIVGGKKNYGLRMANIFTGNPAYFDKGTTIKSGGTNKKILVQGSENVGVSIAKFLSSGNPIANISDLNVEVDGEKNVGFLRHKSYENNIADMVFNSTIMGKFSFGSNAKDSTLLRTDKYGIDLQKDISVSQGKTGNSFAQAVSESGATVDSVIKNNATLTATNLSIFTGLISTGSKANIINNKVIEINGNGDKNIGMVALNNSNLTNNGTVKVVGAGKEKVGIYNDGNVATISNGSKIEVNGPLSTALYNKKTTNISGTVNIKTTGGATGVFSTGGSITSSSGNNLKISAEGGGLGAYVKDSANVNLSGADIDVKDGEAGVASYGVGSQLNLTGATLKYKGSGYAVYSDGNGKINLTSSKIELRGSSTLMELDYSLPVSSRPINTTNTDVKVFSDKVVAINVSNLGIKNITDLSGIKTKLGVNISAGTEGGKTFNKYKELAIDGGTINFNTAVDRAEADTSAGGFFFKKVLGQRLKLNVNENVTSKLSSAVANEFYNDQVVGIEANSSAKAINNTETQVNVAAGKTIDVARTDGTDKGGVGVFVNYGLVNNKGTISVEKDAVANSKAVGVYAVNGSEVTNEGTVDVGGKNSIGLLGLAYRTDTSGNPKINEFGGKVKEGEIEITNKGTVSLNGEETTGIYIKNNNSSATRATAIGLNDIAGNITLSGNKSVGMSGEKATLTNKGTIDVKGQESTGMFAKDFSEMTNNGTINLVDSTSADKPNIGMFTEDKNTVIHNNKDIIGGNNTYGIYGKTINLGAAGKIKVGDNSVGIFSNGKHAAGSTPTINLVANSKIEIGKNESVGVFTTGENQVIKSDGDMKIGDSSYGFVIRGKGTKLFTNNTNGVTLGNDAVFAYSADTTGNIENKTTLTATGSKNYGLYAAGVVNNLADINFGTGVGNVGIYSIAGGNATNGTSTIRPTIRVSKSDTVNKLYGIGMAAGYTDDNGVTRQTGTVENYGTIKVEKDNGIGMYATGSGSKAINRGDIELSGKGTTGMYLDNNAIGENYGTIKTVPNPTNDGIIGVVALNGAVIKNYGTIKIEDGTNLTGIYLAKGKYDAASTGTVTGGINEKQQSDTGKKVAGIEIKAPGNGTAVIKRDGKVITPTSVDTITPLPNSPKVRVGSTELDLKAANLNNIPSMARVLEIGMYVDTSGINYTKPIQGLEKLTNLKKVNLIFGTEATRYTNSKEIEIGKNILEPYNQVISTISTGGGKKFAINSAALTWITTGTQNTDDTFKSVYLVKIPYTAFAKEKDTYNFMAGLEEKYSSASGREKDIFNKLNSLGKGEGHIFAQAIEEMKGTQYSNIQQRVQATGIILDKEFDYLRSEWQTVTKDSNKIKTFGTRGEYKTDTAGVIDYKYNAYGVAYVHENEDIRLGKGIGWYTGIVHNRLKFKDLGNSKEEQLQGKIGLFKSVPFDENNSLNWTVSGNIFVGYNRMNRKFLVVDEIFNAKGKYYNYGIGIKNEIGKEFRLSEDFSLRPYAALNLEYGRTTKIREKTGEMKLEVKANDYISVKPEVGTELAFRHYFGTKTLKTGLSVAYENELGRVANAKNKAKVSNTNADWYTLRGEKEDRRGNVKFDLNLGLDNQKYGVTANVGYDTKGENVRGGLGLRVIF
ncbi:autotransporter-associated N-terminal domain-containing protein [Fusobacterium animalis]|uniref:autotransporter-associated N-terminal domain-containing protein n=1 Tax=Fusobacterium animalis TaxID=76859 RepID=UPI0032431E35